MNGDHFFIFLHYLGNRLLKGIYILEKIGAVIADGDIEITMIPNLWRKRGFQLWNYGLLFPV